MVRIRYRRLPPGASQMRSRRKVLSWLTLPQREMPL
jgi:hypothetical protein